MLFASACTTTQTVTQKRVLQPGEEGDRGVIVGKIPACQPGQVAKDGKCLDLVVAAADGSQESLRARTARSDCLRLDHAVRVAVKRRHELMARQGHDVHVALNGINNECRVRDEEISACQRALEADAEVLSAGELVRKRDASDACRRLAEVYRQMLAQGFKHAP